LRPGDTSLGERDVEDMEQWLARLHAAAPQAVVMVRIDSGADCAALLSAIHRSEAFFVIKLKLTANLVGGVWATKRWRTVERDALGKPSRQVALVHFKRDDWPDAQYRVFAVRSTERDVTVR
jgi:hypothetical protein